MDRCLLSSGDWLLPKGLGLCPGRVLQGTIRSWKHVDRTGGEEEWIGMGAAWLHQWGGGVPWHGPSLPNGSKCFLGGLGSPLAGQAGPRLAVGPRTRVEGGGKGAALVWAPPQMSSSPKRVHVEGLVGQGLHLLGQEVRGGKEGHSLRPRVQQGPSGWALAGQAHPDSPSRSRATQRPCPDLETPWGSEARGQHAGQGWNVTLLWLAGDSGPPGSGVREGMYRGYHTSTDLRRPEEAPSASRTGCNASCWGKAGLPFSSNLGVRWGLDTLG